MKEEWNKIKDINKREQAVKDYLKENPQDESAEEYLAVLQQRYGKARMRNRPDHFAHACIMMHVLSDKKVNALNKRSLQSEYRTYLEELYITKEPSDALKKEWRRFASDYIVMTLKSNSRAAFLGMGHRNEHTAAQHVAEEINLLVNELPHRFGMEEEMAVFRAIMIEAYLEEMEDGEEIWNTYFNKNH